MFQKDDGKRKFQCFVCGRVYTDYKEFCTHITEEHEEGRDYVLCPLARCGVPIRDIKAHFKVVHVGETVPAGIQHRATLWKDFNNKTGKMQTRKPKFRKGTFVSTKNKGKEFIYRSGYECEVYEYLEQIHDIVAYDAEPFPIEYHFNGEIHKYIPDLSIHFANNAVEIWEIKPSNQTHLDKNKAKWASAEIFCQQRGWKFQVITEQGIEKLKKLAKS